MARVNWVGVGERFYETGIDRGMLYVGELPGVPWSGITSVNENPIGGNINNRFYDGRNYLNTTSPERYSAVLSAFYSPKEFDACEGIAPAALGLKATAQVRATFGLSYRSRIGNDVEGPDFGYKLHLVYNAIAEPTNRDYNSINDDPNAAPLSWNIQAKPVQFGENRYSAHYIIDSTETDAMALAHLEDILYGSNVETPRLPDLWEIATILNDMSEFTIIDNGDGTFTAIGSATAVSMIGGGIFQLTHDEAVIPIDDNTYTAMSSSEVP